jgi:membrane-associated phospholipid phosphatase
VKIQRLGFKLIFVLVFLFGATARAEWDWVADLESPVTTDAKWILAAGTGLTVATTVAHHSTFADFETRTSTEKPLGSTSKYGNALGQLIPNAAYLGGALISTWAGSPLGEYRAILMLEATAYAGLLANVLKYTVREGRPYDSSVRNSFPSGHSATAFAFAGVVAAEHGWYWGVTAMAMAGFVGYSRINDNQHHVHDVVGGATIGLACAYGIYYAHKPLREKAASQVLILPQALPGGAEVAALWQF